MAKREGDVYCDWCNIFHNPPACPECSETRDLPQPKARGPFKANLASETNMDGEKRFHVHIHDLKWDDVLWLVNNGIILF